MSDNRCRVKWPNDVWIEERKVAGVLIEARPPEWAVIGIGVNVAIGEGEFPGELRWPAVSVGGGVGVGAVRRALNERLAVWVETPVEGVLGEFRGRDALKGREVCGGTLHRGRVTSRTPGTWTAPGLPTGSTTGGTSSWSAASGERRSLGAGEVQLSLPDAET